MRQEKRSLASTLFSFQISSHVAGKSEVGETGRDTVFVGCLSLEDMSPASSLNLALISLPTDLGGNGESLALRSRPCKTMYVQLEG